MSKENKLSTQNQILEELTLFPCRVAQYFFLLNTLEKKSDETANSLEEAKKNLLRSETRSNDNGVGENSYKTRTAIPGSNTAPSFAPPLSCTSSATDSITTLRDLFAVHRKILKDKLFVDENAMEWIRCARRALNPFLSSKFESTPESGSVCFPHDPQTGSMSCSNLFGDNCTSLLSSPTLNPLYPSTFLSHFANADSQTSNYSRPINMSLRNLGNVDNLLDTSGDELIPNIVGTPQAFHVRKKRRGSTVSQSSRSVFSPFTETNYAGLHDKSVSEGPVERKRLGGQSVSSSCYGVSGSGPRKSISPHLHSTFKSFAYDPSSQVEDTPSSCGGTAAEGLIIKLGSQKRRKRRTLGFYKQNQTESDKNPSMKGHNEHKPAETSDSFLLDPVSTLEDNDDSLCPVCQKATGGQMVQCDKCDKWCHCGCVGFIVDAMAAEKQFCCPKCCKDKP